MAQHHLPSLAALDAREVTAPTDRKYLGIIGKDAWDRQLVALKDLDQAWRSFAKFAKEARAESKLQKEKYERYERRREYKKQARRGEKWIAVEERAQLACKRTQALLELINQTREDAGWEKLKEEDGTIIKTEDCTREQRAEDEQMRAEAAKKAAAKIPMGRVQPQPPVVRGDVVAPPSPTPTPAPMYQPQPQPPPQYQPQPQYQPPPQYQPQQPQYVPQPVYPQLYPNPPPAYGSGY